MQMCFTIKRNGIVVLFMSTFASYLTNRCMGIASFGNGHLARDAIIGQQYYVQSMMAWEIENPYGIVGESPSAWSATHHSMPF